MGRGKAIDVCIYIALYALSNELESCFLREWKVLRKFLCFKMGAPGSSSAKQTRIWRALSTTFTMSWTGSSHTRTALSQAVNDALTDLISLPEALRCVLVRPSLLTG